eukprot:TRINITY_DN8136_c0_g1_i1.p1 TRINITY_DN8136_c0_g1~~TRINITY_DN8136_c0_g1_i1.p1  ORF type:complete len:420 (-),score=63.38 TRINITY_DN8136_c0_g1_i1:318-1577(-)
MDPRLGMFESRWNMERSLSASGSSASLHSSCSSSDDDWSPPPGRRTETIYDVDAYIAQERRRVAERSFVGEGDAVGNSISESTSDDDGAPVLPRRTGTIYDFEAYVAPRYTGIADGSGDDESDGSSSDGDGAPVNPRRTETIYDWEPYVAPRYTGVADGSGDDESDESGSDGDIAPVFPRRTETIYDFDAVLARRQTSMANGSGDTGAVEGIADATRTHIGYNRNELFAPPRQTRVAESAGAGEGFDGPFNACSQQSPTRSSSNERAVALVSSSHLPARPDSFDGDDAEHHGTHPRSCTEGDSRQGSCLRENRSSSLAAVREVTFALAEEVLENAIGEAAVLAPALHDDFGELVLSTSSVDVPRKASMHADFNEVLPSARAGDFAEESPLARALDVLTAPVRKSIIAMARARRGQMQHP